MEHKYKFTCNDCQHQWRSKDYEETGDGLRYHFGYKCPNCDGKDISPEDDD
jgi:Zn finger protein HypA/HybF involved in hydrogenase expression